MSKTFSLLLQIILLCVFSLLLSGCPGGGEFPKMCGNCDSDVYTLNINSNVQGSGNIIRTPDKDSYTKGDIVVVEYVPNNNYVFDHWTVTPTNHLVSNSPSSITAIVITENTYMCAWVDEKKKYLRVQWDKNMFTTVNISGGYDEEDCSLGNIGCKKLYFDKGSTTQVNAILNPSYKIYLNPPCAPPCECQNISVLWQHHQPSAVSAIWNQNNVELVVDDNIELTPLAFCRDEMAFKFLTLTSEGGNGAEVLFANGQNITFMPCGYFKYSNYIVDPVKFAFGVEPYWTQSFIYWLGSSIYVSNPIDNCCNINYTGNNLFNAILANRVALGVGQSFESYNEGNIERENGKGGVVRIENEYLYPLGGTLRKMPYQWNPYPLIVYDCFSYEPDFYGNPINLHAIPCKGLKFSHWEIEEYPNFYSNSENLTLYMNKWGSVAGEIHVPSGTDSLSVEAIFKNRVLVVEPSLGGPLFPGTEADTQLKNLCYGVDDITGNNSFTWVNKLPEYDIFCYAGHGGVSHLALESNSNCGAQCSECQQSCPEYCVMRECHVRDIMWNGNMARGSYVFVYLLACYCGEEAELWRTAFNAQCLLAVDISLNNFSANYFDSKFWECISEGQSIADSANTAAQYANILGHQIIAGNGNIILKE